MFRRIHYRRWLVAGLGLAALVVPTTALAGNGVLDGRSPDTKDASQAAAQANVDPMVTKYLLRYGYSLSQINAMRAAPPVSVPKQAEPALLGGRSPDTRDAALSAAQANVDPMVTKYLLRYGYTPSQIAAMRNTPAPGTTELPWNGVKVSQETMTYLLWHGYTPSQITAMLAGAQTSTPKEVPATPVDGRSPDTVDSAVQAHAPVVTVTRDPGFQWGDFGIGGAAAIGAMILLGLSVRFLTNRQDRGGQTPVAAA